jgi:hypothetical protein
MSVGNVARITAVLAASVAAAASATSSSNQNQSPAGPGSQSSPPPPQEMDPNLALGLWRSTFGAVKIEADSSHGGLPAGSVQGVWMYQRQGQEVIGYFAGNLRGNVLQFHWQEPNDPPLTGDGYLVFDAQGRQYAGRWWSDKRDRIGDWNGWRQSASQGARASVGGSADPYGGQGYGYQPGRRQPYQRPSPYQQQPYQRPSPYQQQPYQQQPYQQQPYQQQPYQQQPYQQPYQQQPYQQQPYQQQPYQQQPPQPSPRPNYD